MKLNKGEINSNDKTNDLCKGIRIKLKGLFIYMYMFGLVFAQVYHMNTDKEGVGSPGTLVTGS